jgi:hypothetical protein
VSPFQNTIKMGHNDISTDQGTFLIKKEFINNEEENKEDTNPIELTDDIDAREKGKNNFR